MRILVVSYMYPNSTNEILGIFVEEQVKALVKRGCEIKVIAPVAYCPPFPFNRISKRVRQCSNIAFRELRNGVEVYHPRYITTAPLLIGNVLIHLHGWLIYRGIKNLATKIVSDFNPHIIHVHGVFPDGYAVALLKKDLKKNIKVVVTTHRGDLISAFNNNLIMKRTRFSLNHSDFIMPVSPALKDMASSISNQSQIRVIPNGVDIHKFELTAEDIKWIEQKKRDFNGKKTLLFLGQLTERKGIKELFKAFTQINSYRDDLILVLVGGNGDVSDYITNNNSKEKVKLIGPVKHEQVKLWMSLCDIFTLPSYREGMPVAMLEAMACGKPIIVTNIDGVREIIKNRENGLLIQPGDVDSLVESIDFLLDNPDEARGLGEKARETILSNYTWAKNAEKTMEVYKEVCSEFNQQ